MPLKIIRPAGGQTWYVSGTIAGTRIRQSTKTTSRSLAESIRVKREAELEQRRVFGARSVATFSEALNLYLDRGGEARFLAPLLDRFGAMRLADIKQADLDRGIAELYPGAKPSTRNRQGYTPFIAVMNEAAINDLCAYQKWRRPRAHNKRTKFRWLWPHEFEDVWLAAPAHGRALLDLFVGAGVREAEGAWLDWRDVSLPLAQGWIWDAKNGESRRIELPPRTVSSLANLDHREGRILLNGGGGEYHLDLRGGGALGKGVRQWADSAALEPFGTHTLRHTFATWFYSATLDRERLKALGGWKSDEVDRYCHLAPRGLADELKRYGWDFSGGTNRDETLPVFSQQ
jgi:integrase